MPSRHIGAARKRELRSVGYAPFLLNKLELYPRFASSFMEHVPHRQVLSGRRGKVQTEHWVPKLYCEIFTVLSGFVSPAFSLTLESRGTDITFDVGGMPTTKMDFLLTIILERLLATDDYKNRLEWSREKWLSLNRESPAAYRRLARWFGLNNIVQEFVEGAKRHEVFWQADGTCYVCCRKIGEKATETGVRYLTPMNLFADDYSSKLEAEVRLGMLTLPPCYKFALLTMGADEHSTSYSLEGDSSECLSPSPSSLRSQTIPFQVLDQRNRQVILRIA